MKINLKKKGKQTQKRASMHFTALAHLSNPHRNPEDTNKKQIHIYAKKRREKETKLVSLLFASINPLETQDLKSAQFIGNKKKITQRAPVYFTALTPNLTARLTSMKNIPRSDKKNID